MATTNTKTELSSCCGATVTYHDDGLICKRCYGTVEWSAE